MRLSLCEEDLLVCAPPEAGVVGGRYASAAPRSLLELVPSPPASRLEPKLLLLGEAVEESERNFAALRREELRAVGRAAAARQGGDKESEALRLKLLEHVHAAARSAVEAGQGAAHALKLEMAEAKRQRERELAERRQRLAEAAAIAEEQAKAEAEAEAAAKAAAEAAAAAKVAEDAKPPAEAKSAQHGQATDGDTVAKPPTETVGVAAPGGPCGNLAQVAQPVLATAATPACSSGPIGESSVPASVVVSAELAPAPTKAIAPQTDVGILTTEWEEALAFVQKYDSNKPRGDLGAQCRQVALFVGQTSRVQYVVWEKAEAVAEALNFMHHQGGDPALHAGLSAFSAKLLAQGSMVVEKSPAMAYPLAMLALSVGTRFEAVWHHLRHHFIHACSYVVPHYIRRPQGATDEQWKKVMGYAERGRGFEPKEQYYNRMAGYVTLWAAILQAEHLPLYDHRSESMTMHHTPNPHGVTTAWSWIARVLNQKPQRITATILLAFLKPCAHALCRTYPRQFRKLLRFLHVVYLPMLEGLVGASATQGTQGAEERAALAVLTSWVEDTRQALERSGGQLQPPADATEMPNFIIPDDTRDADEGW